MLGIANSVDPDQTATLRYIPLNIHENLSILRIERRRPLTINHHDLLNGFCCV